MKPCRVCWGAPYGPVIVVQRGVEAARELLDIYIQMHLYMHTFYIHICTQIHLSFSLSLTHSLTHSFSLSLSVSLSLSLSLCIYTYMQLVRVRHLLSQSLHVSPIHVKASRYTACPKPSLQLHWPLDAVDRSHEEHPSYTPHPTPQTRNLKPQTPNPKSQTPNPIP